MDLYVHSRGGRKKLTLSPECTVGEALASIKRDAGAAEGQHTRVVHKGQVLTASQASLRLQDVGLKNGDALLVLPVTPLPLTGTPQTWPAPSSSAIKSAITAEAKKLGVEHRLRPASRTAAGMGQPHMPPELITLEQPLMQLLQALDSRAPSARAGGAGLTSDPVAAAMQQLATAFDLPLHELHGGGRPQRRGRDQQAENDEEADEEDEEENEDEEEDEESEGAAQPEIRPPEPPAQAIEQLTGMGFTEPVVRKALVLSRNSVDIALEWLLGHSEDPDASEPPTQQQLRQVYGAPSSRTIAESEAVNQLCEMGFERPAATAAIRRFRNVEVALAYLLQSGSSSPPVASPAPAAPATDNNTNTNDAENADASNAEASPAATTPSQPPLIHTHPRVTHSLQHPQPPNNDSSNSTPPALSTSTSGSSANASQQQQTQEQSQQQSHEQQQQGVSGGAVSQEHPTQQQASSQQDGQREGNADCEGTHCQEPKLESGGQCNGGSSRS